MENFEDMKEMWIELNNRMTALEEENRRLAKRVTDEKYRNIKEKLVRKYKIFIAVACIMIIYIYCFLFFNPLVNEKYRLLATIYMICFFALCAAVDSYLMYKIKELDIYNSNVRDITRIAAKNWKIHKIFLVTGLPLAIGAIVLLALALNANEFVYLGMIVGGIVGFLIGFKQLMKFRDYYRLLQIQDE